MSSFSKNICEEGKVYTVRKQMTVLIKCLDRENQMNVPEIQERVSTIRNTNKFLMQGFVSDLFRALLEVSYNNIVLEVLLEILSHLLLFIQDHNLIIQQLMEHLTFILNGKPIDDKMRLMLSDIVEKIQVTKLGSSRLKEVEQSLSQFTSYCTKIIRNCST